MAQSIEIRNMDTPTPKKFIFFEAEVKSARWGLNVKRFKFEEPDGDGSSNLSINLGTEKTISFPFKLFLTSEDAADGTHSSTIKTIVEKVEYLIGVKDTDGITFTKDPYLKTGIEDFYFIDITSHTGNWINNKVQLDSISFDPNSGNPNSLTGNISFTIGGGRQ